MNRAPANAAAISVLALVACNAIGILGLGWLVLDILTNDGFMIIEVSLCAAITFGLVGLIVAGLWLYRRGKNSAAIIILAIGAAPVLAALGFLIYLDANPIDWR